MNQEKNSPEALFEKGKRFYLSTSSDDINPSLAIFYFNQAAKAGYVPAQRLLGTCYLDGRFSGPDYKLAHYWLSEAAKKNDGQAAYTLAKMYINGQGVEKDLHLAFQLLDMECTRNLFEVQELKQRLIEEFSSKYKDLKDRLEKFEKKRRALYSSHRQRFIQPWFFGNRHFSKDEFDVWSALSAGSIGADDAYNILTALMTQYYERREASVPDKI